MITREVRDESSAGGGDWGYWAPTGSRSETTRHSVFGLVRSAESTRMLTEMGAEVVIGDALDAASVRAAIARVRPDAVVHELTSLPRHYTPAEMKAAAGRGGRC